MVSRVPFRLAVCLAVFALATFASAAKEKTSSPVGVPGGGGSAIDWNVAVSGHESIDIVVVDPLGDVVFAKKFNAGRNPVVRLQDLGAPVLDGVYGYELRVTPRVAPGVATALAHARAANDEAAAKKIMREAGLANALVQSGSFAVINGSIVSPALDEPGARDAAVSRRVTTDAAGRPQFKPETDDQVIPDDLIVQGSICVGLDCVNNESFGFDTVRLKENNTRIKFDDTSSSAGFAANDWQLTANDSASGGSSKFSVEDITGAKVPMTITAGASTNSIFVDSTGRVGFRTSTPVLDLHVATSNTPAIRLEQNNSGGFTAQTWDIGANEANFFVRDVTSGSRLPFRIRPGATTSSIDISADGDVGVNTASPNANARLDVFDSTQLRARIALTGQEYYQAGNTSTDGVAIVLGVNRANNRQIWFGDTSQLAQNSTNQVIRFYPQNGEISAISTDSTSGKSLKINPLGGNVGIGTSSPTSRLHVNGGDIRVSGGSFIDDGVTLNVPDYVFEPGYTLMPIEHLAEFVRTNKHLPNVPPAADVKSQGLNVSHFQMRLLEKVEELTLYTLAQHEENKKLQERIDALERQLASQQ